MIENARFIQSIMKSRTRKNKLEVHRQWPKSAFQRFYWINKGRKKTGKTQLSFIHGKFEGRKMPSTVGVFV